MSAPATPVPISISPLQYCIRVDKHTSADTKLHETWKSQFGLGRRPPSFKSVTRDSDSGSL